MNKKEEYCFKIPIWSSSWGLQPPKQRKVCSILHGENKTKAEAYALQCPWCCDKRHHPERLLQNCAVVRGTTTRSQLRDPILSVYQELTWLRDTHKPSSRSVNQRPRSHQSPIVKKRVLFKRQLWINSTHSVTV